MLTKSQSMGLGDGKRYGLAVFCGINGTCLLVVK